MTYIHDQIRQITEPTAQIRYCIITY